MGDGGCFFLCFLGRWFVETCEAPVIFAHPYGESPFCLVFGSYFGMIPFFPCEQLSKTRDTL